MQEKFRGLEVGVDGEELWQLLLDEITEPSFIIKIQATNLRIKTKNARKQGTKAPIRTTHLQLKQGRPLHASETRNVPQLPSTLPRTLQWRPQKVQTKPSINWNLKGYILGDDGEGRFWLGWGVWWWWGALWGGRWKWYVKSGRIWGVRRRRGGRLGELRGLRIRLGWWGRNRMRVGWPVQCQI